MRKRHACLGAASLDEEMHAVVERLGVPHKVGIYLEYKSTAGY